MTDDLEPAPPCAANRCTRPAATGATLCAPDLDRLADMLTGIQTEYELLSAAPSMQGRDVGMIGGTALASQRAPGNTHIMAMRDTRLTWWNGVDQWGADNTPSVFQALHEWAAVVRDSRSLTTPAPLTVATERRVLASQLDWITTQDWAGTFYDQIRQLWGALLAANNGQSRSRKAPVGYCDQGVPECGGSLWAAQDGTHVTCGTCGFTYDQAELRRLGDSLLKQGYVLIERASWYTDVPAGTIRRWVSEGRITSEKQGRRLCVNVSEVEELRDTRRSPRAAS